MLVIVPGENRIRRIGAYHAPDSASGAGETMPPLPPPPGEAPVPSATEPPKPSKENGGGMLSSLRVSLMPSDLEGRPAPNLARGLLLLGIVIAAETVLIGVLYFTVSHTVNNRIRQRDLDLVNIQQLDAEVQALEQEAAPAVTYYYQLSNARQILDKHVYWTQFFAFLEKNTLNSVKYNAFSADAYSGNVSVDGIGLTYRDVAEQIISLRENPLVEEVRSTSAAAAVNELGVVEGVSFSMLIRMKPQAWLRTVAPVTQPAAAPAPAPTPAAVPEPASAPAETAVPAETPAEVPADAAVPPPTEPVTAETPSAESPSATVAEPAAPPPENPTAPVTP